MRTAVVFVGGPHRHGPRPGHHPGLVGLRADQVVAVDSGLHLALDTAGRSTWSWATWTRSVRRPSAMRWPRGRASSAIRSTRTPPTWSWRSTGSWPTGPSRSSSSARTQDGWTTSWAGCSRCARHASPRWGSGPGWVAHWWCPCTSVSAFAGRPGQQVSILPVHGAADGVRTEGLRWPLQGERLEPGTSRGMSNEFVADVAEVSVDAGCVAVVVPEEEQSCSRCRWHVGAWWSCGDVRWCRRLAAAATRAAPGDGSSGGETVTAC